MRTKRKTILTIMTITLIILGISHEVCAQKIWANDKLMGSKVKGIVSEIEITERCNPKSDSVKMKWAEIIPQLAAISFNVVGSFTKKKPENYGSEFTSLNSELVLSECVKKDEVEAKISLRAFEKGKATESSEIIRYYQISMKESEGLLSISLNCIRGNTVPVKTRKKYDLIFEKLTFHLNGVVRGSEGALFGKEIGNFSINNLIPSFRSSPENIANSTLQVALPKLEDQESYHAFSICCTVTHLNPYGLSTSQWNEAFSDSKDSFTEIIKLAVGTED